MNHLVLAIFAVPLLASVTVAALGRRRERLVSRVALFAAALHGGLALTLVALWAGGGAQHWELELGDLYSSPGYNFPLVLYVDGVAATFVGVIGFLTAVIVRYSRYYLHRESGYARYFTTIFLFVFGMDVLVLAGTLDLLFAGWEIVGLSSFLLIAFYRERTAPVENAVQTYAIYRFCDTGLLIGAWVGHLIFHEAHYMSELKTLAGSPELASLGTLPLLCLGLLCLLAACGKSAQVPFCFWLPRAMEGPTPSSAIFYGALSIHAGVYLLIRTMPLWDAIPAARTAVGAVGVLSAIVATLSGRTQSNIKGQIAYASITQVGLMLLELSLGLRSLVLLHFAGHASLRCYQLLVSPSVVAHLLRVQGSASQDLKVSDWSIERLLPTKVRSGIYVFALHEGYLEAAWRRFFYDPIGRFVERHSPFLVWNAAASCSLLAAAAVIGVDREAFHDVTLYLAGVAPAWALGLLALRSLTGARTYDLRYCHGLADRKPRAAWALFIAFLGLTGFPFAPTFVGEDLLLHHAAGDHLWVAAAITAAFVVTGVALVRVVARLTWGTAPPARLTREERPEERAVASAGRR